MPRIRWFVLFLLGALVGSGCRDEAKVSEKPAESLPSSPAQSPIIPAGATIPVGDVESVTLYSIDGRFGDSRQTAKGAELFHGRPVLGKVEILDRKAQTDLIGVFNGGTARPDDMAKCFCPRHGLRMVLAGKTVDYLICFSCRQYLTYGDERFSDARFVDSSPHETFDAVLKAAKIPLAPEGGCE